MQLHRFCALLSSCPTFIDRMARPKEPIREKTARDRYEDAEHRFITRRVVRAWQLRGSAPWIGAGFSAPRELPRGTWVVESVESGRRWPVAPDLFSRKYRMLRTGLYLNTESVAFEGSPPSGVVHSTEGAQQVPTDKSVLIAVGESGDRWPVTRHRADTEYHPDTTWNRFYLLFRPGRRRHLATLFAGLLALFAGVFLTVAALVVVPAGNRTPFENYDVWVRELIAIVVILGPVMAVLGATMTTKRIGRSWLLLVLLTSGIWLIVLSFLLGIRRGAGLSESVLAAARVFNDVNKFQTYRGTARQISLTISVAAAVIALVSFAAIGRTLLRDSWDRISARVRRFDVVVWGLGETAIRLLQALRADIQLAQRTRRVIVIEQDRQNPYIQIARALGVPVVIGDEQSIGLLRQVATRWLGGQWKPRYLLGLTGNETANLMLPDLVATVRSELNAVDQAFISLRVENPWTRERLFTSEVNRESRIDVSTVSAAGSNAETVMRLAKERSALGQSGSLVIVGDSPLGVAVIEAARRERLLEQTLSAAATAITSAPVRHTGWTDVHWIATTNPHTWAAPLLPADIAWVGDDDDIQPEMPPALAVYIHTVKENASAPKIKKLVERIGAGIVVLCETIPEPTAIQLMHVRTDCDACLCFVEVPGSRDRRYDSADSGAAAHDLHGPCVLPSQGRIDLTHHLYGEPGAIAAVVHEYFRVTRQRLRGADDLDDQLWDSPWLSASAREETYDFVQRAIDACSKIAGFVVRPLGNDDLAAFPPEWFGMVDILAEAEHEEWCKTKRTAGYAYAKVRNDRLKTHDLLVPWDRLPSGERERNRALFRVLPGLLLATRRVLVEKVPHQDGGSTLRPDASGVSGGPHPTPGFAPKDLTTQTCCDRIR